MKSSRYQVSGFMFWIRRFSNNYFVSIVLVFGIGLLVGCNQKPSTKEKEEVLLAPKPVLSFSGDILQAKTFSDSTYQILLGNMVAAKELAEQYPDSAELAIWYGRRMAYMGRYHEAIDIFTDAIKRFPNDHRLLRHRGHRYITTRQLDLAIADFEKAAMKSKDEPNAIEPDGIPNKLNKPLGNDKFNIYYHQGLAYYLNGEFEKALFSYKKCMEVSDNDDLIVATSYWMYMSYIRSGDLETAQRFLLETETDAVEMIENDVYLALLQVFKGEKTGEEVFAMSNHPTYQYGVGFYHWINNNEEMARSVWQKALEHESWDSFGYIAAEAEGLKRGTISWYQVFYESQPERMLKFEYKVTSSLFEYGNDVKYNTHFVNGQEFDLYSFLIRDDSVFHQGVHCSLLSAIAMDDLAGDKLEFKVYDYDDAKISDEESFLFINSKNELIAVYNWTMGPLLILTFDGESPEPIYDFVVSKSTQDTIHEMRKRTMKSNNS